MGIQFHTPCSECAENRASEQLAKQNRDRLAALRESWIERTPALYRATDPNHPCINQELLQRILEYDPRSGKGIGLHGPTGGGKTRMMYLLLHKLHFSGVGVLALKAIDISRASSEEFDQDQRTREIARALLRSAAKTEVLFLDDIGKERLTECAELKLCWLVEDRTSNARPILWTSNFVGADLRKIMSDNRGPAITRRLAEFSSIFFVPVRYTEQTETRSAKAV